MTVIMRVEGYTNLWDIHECGKGNRLVGVVCIANEHSLKVMNLDLESFAFKAPILELTNLPSHISKIASLTGTLIALVLANGTIQILNLS
jgi:hypothetical protein